MKNRTFAQAILFCLLVALIALPAIVSAQAPQARRGRGGLYGDLQPDRERRHPLSGEPVAQRGAVCRHRLRAQALT